MSLFAYLSVWLSICSLFVCLFICLSVYLSVCLSVCLSICCLFMTKPASQGWCPGHSCSCPSVVCQSRDYKRARVAHLLLCNRSRSHHKHRSHNFKMTINPNQKVPVKWNTNRKVPIKSACQRKKSKWIVFKNPTKKVPIKTSYQ